jgi:hypothetical protein
MRGYESIGVDKHGNPLLNDGILTDRGDKKYETKDSGQSVEFDSGMKRDSAEGKPRYDLLPIDMLTRLAGLYARGAKLYGDWNWRTANSEEELQRFKQSAFRHFMQWADGQQDEDHAMAVCFNIFAFEYLQGKLENAGDG